MTDTMADIYADCSDNNGIPDLIAYAKEGHTRISFKVSEGTSYHWSAHGQLADQAHHLGLTVDHYHWLTPNVSAAAQAGWFLEWVRYHTVAGDRIMTDLERSDGLSDVSDSHRASQLATFTARVGLALSLEQIVYAPDWYLDGKPITVVECRRFPNVASNYDPITVLPNPHGLNRVAWQYTQTGRAAGFSGHVDLNRNLIPEDPPMLAADWTRLQAMLDAQTAAIDDKIAGVANSAFGAEKAAAVAEAAALATRTELTAFIATQGDKP